MQIGGETYSTIDLVLNSVLYIRNKIKKLNFENQPIGVCLKELLVLSFDFYMDKYRVLENRIYMSAALLSPKYKSLNYATDEEKKKFVR